MWRRFPKGTFANFQVNSNVLNKVMNASIGIFVFVTVEKKVAYVPPSLRKAAAEQPKPSDFPALAQKPDKISPQEKLIKNITLKLKQISLLKTKQASGEPLELNQVLYMP